MRLTNTLTGRVEEFRPLREGEVRMYHCGPTVYRRNHLGNYRAYLLGGMKEIYEAVAARREVPCPPAEAKKIRTLREWDERVVAPRHGFAGADDYYARASVAPRIGALRVPALVVAVDDDPMVPAAAIRPWLDPGHPRLTFRWLSTGGHLGAYRHVDLGLGFHPALGLERQLYRWLAGRA